MNIIEPYARILELPDREAGIALLRKIEWIARVSHESQDAQTPESWQRFLTSVVLGHGDWSVTEHASVTVEMVIDRGISHEIVRHRIGAYTQSSTRFINHTKKPASIIRTPLKTVDAAEVWNAAVEYVEKAYEALIQLGEAPQIARSVLPHTLATRLIVTYNLRSWRHFFLMRSTKEAHPQLREVSIPLLKKFQELIPLLYDDIIPNASQRDNLCLPR